MASYNYYKLGIELTLTAEDYNLLLDYCIDSVLSIDELLFQFVTDGIEDLKMLSL